MTSKLTWWGATELIAHSAHCAGLIGVTKGLLACGNLNEAASLLDFNAVLALYVTGKVGYHLAAEPAKRALLALYGEAPPRWSETVAKVTRWLLPTAQIRVSSAWGLLDFVVQGAIVAPLLLWAAHVPQLGVMASLAALGLHEVLAAICVCEIVQGFRRRSPYVR